MAKSTRIDKSRDGGSFVAITKDVLNSKTFCSLSYSAVALLLSILAQYNSDNNGKLVACRKYLKPRGWSSNATVTKALNELLESGLLVMTRRGHKPNKASWFGISWYSLGHKVDVKLLDITGRQFEVERQRWKSAERSGYQMIGRPINGVGVNPTVPINGTGELPAAPKMSATRSKFQTSLHQ